MGGVGGDRRPSQDYTNGFPRQLTAELPVNLRAGSSRGTSASSQGRLGGLGKAVIPDIMQQEARGVVMNHDLATNDQLPDRTRMQQDAFDPAAASQRPSLPLSTAPSGADYETCGKCLQPKHDGPCITVQTGRESRGSNRQSEGSHVHLTPRPSSRGSGKAAAAVGAAAAGGKSPVPPAERPSSGAGGQRPPSGRAASRGGK